MNRIESVESSSKGPCTLVFIILKNGTHFVLERTLRAHIVSKNPDGVCNPQLGDDNIGNSILRIVVTLISMLWAGFSGTAHRAVGEER